MKRIVDSIFLTLLFIIFSSISINAQTPKNFLLKGKSIQGDLTVTDAHEYFVSLKAGQFAAIKIKQKTIGVYYAVFNPHGNLIQFDDFNGIDFSEIITIDSHVEGEYKIQVAWDRGEPRSGSYEIVLDKLEKSAKTPAEKTVQLLDSWYPPQSPGAVVAVVKNNKVLFKGVRGLANVEYNMPVTNSTVFELASVSKQFTAFAIALLIDKGLLSLDDDIRKYLPEVPDFGQKITINHLIHHTSGIRDWTHCFQLAGYKMEDVMTIEAILRFVANQKQLNFNPGDNISYSNTGYNLLAEIVQRVTKQSFPSWMKDNIFKPLAMNDTFIKEDYRQAIKNEAFSYTSDGSPYKLKKGNMAVYGSTSLHSSIDDLIKWINNFDRHLVGNENVFNLIKTKAVLNDGKTIGYAFGNEIATYKKINSIQHLGLILGYRTSVRQFPDQHLAVIYLSNDGNDATYARANKVADLYLQGVEPPAPLKMPKFSDPNQTIPTPDISTQELVNYVGIYYSEELNAAYSLKMEGNALIAQTPRLEKISLKFSKKDNFSTKNIFFQRLEFIRNANNEIIGLKVSNSSDKNILFNKFKKYD